MGIIKERSMISPEHFYSESDRLGPEAKKRMWKKIRRKINRRHSFILFTIPDKRSFVYGIAVAVIIFFFTAGITSTFRNAFERSQPQAAKLDAAYMTAIREFEKVVPEIFISETDGTETSGLISVRRDELNNIEAAIHRLQADAVRGDLSPIRQKRLRQLYSMKLNILQKMLENGEIEI